VGLTPQKLILQDGRVQIVDWQGALVIRKVGESWRLMSECFTHELPDDFDIANPIVSELFNFELVR
jgi:hypothetical protein